MFPEQFPGAGILGRSFLNFSNHTSSYLMKWHLVASGLKHMTNKTVLEDRHRFSLKKFFNIHYLSI